MSLPADTLPSQQDVRVQGDLWPAPNQLPEVLLIPCNSGAPLARQGDAIYPVQALVEQHHSAFSVLLLTTGTQLLQPSDCLATCETPSTSPGL